MDEQLRITATAEVDQVRAEMDAMLTKIVDKIRDDLTAGKDRSMVYAMLVVDIVKTFGLPKQGPGTYMLAAALLRLATREDPCSNDSPTAPDASSS